MKNVVDRVEAIVTTQGICVKFFVGAVEVSLNLEPEQLAMNPVEIRGKKFGYKSDLCILHNESQETRARATENFTKEFCTTQQASDYMYGPTSEDLFDALLFARLKAKRLETIAYLMKQEELHNAVELAGCLGSDPRKVTSRSEKLCGCDVECNC